MAWVYDNSRSPKDGGGWIERADVGAWAGDGVTGERARRQQESLDKLRREQGIWKMADRAAFGAAAIPFGAAALSALGAAGGASLPAAATAGVGFNAAPALSASLNAGAGVPWLRLAELGVGTGLNLLGSSRAGRADDRATEAERAAQERQYALLEAQEKTRHEEWQANQALQERAFLAQEEQARLDRRDADEARRLGYEDRAFDRYKYERREPNRRASYGGLVNLSALSGIDVGPYQSSVMPDDYAQRRGLVPLGSLG